jgi:hypothetical protein
MKNERHAKIDPTYEVLFTGYAALLDRDYYWGTKKREERKEGFRGRAGGQGI